MASHNQNPVHEMRSALFESGCIPIDLPDEHEPSDERLWTTSELIAAAYWAGFGGIVVAVAAAFAWESFL